MEQTIKTPVAMLDKWAKKLGNNTYLQQPINGEYIEFSWLQVQQKVQQLAGALRHLGFVPGDKIAILSKNCAEWFITDLALMHGGYISVPIYPTANTDTISYVLEHSEAKGIFIGKLDYWAEQESAISGDLLRFSFPYETMPCQYNWDNLLSLGAPLTEAPYPELDQIMTLIYTSGSTGQPKGVVQTYRSYCSTSALAARDIEIDHQDKLLSYLPLAHITERVAMEGTSLYMGTPVAFVESLDSFVADVQRASPTVFFSVPRLWSLFQKNIIEKVGGYKKLNLLLKIPIVNTLVKNKIKKGLGLDNCRLFGSGSAPIPHALLEWYKKIDINISEGWGMTENCAYSIFNLPFNPNKLGTVGKPIEGCEIKQGDNGELLVKNPGLMQGYYKDEAATKAAFDSEGFLHTGDVCAIDEDGYIKITGRIKDNFKTAKGKYVVPVPIERKLAQDPHIELLCVIGSGMPHPITLVQLAEGAKLQPREEVRASLKATLDSVNPTLESHSTIDAMIVVSEPWTVENDILTPTLKIKRHVLEQTFSEKVDGIRGQSIKWQDEI
ncbi:MAG: AMP-binding protein [Parashewanella sp.]